MNTYAVGNQIECLFAFTDRPLTSVEQQAFLAGNGLPPGVGLDQITVKMDWKLNDGPTTTLADGQILHDAPGAYHAIITTAAAGSVEYRGYSLDGAGNPLASTPAYTFAVTEF
jgi:hypothetical protein